MRLKHPIPNAVWGAPFGWRGAVAGLPPGLHTGQDFPAGFGERVHAAAAGVAYRRHQPGGLGNYIHLVHSNGRETFYAHLQGFAVRDGARVKAGEVIGYVGSTGASTGPHLHFGYRKHGTWINPAPLIYTSLAAGTASAKFKGDMNIMAADFFMRRNQAAKVYAVELMGGKEGKPAFRSVSSLEWTVYQRARKNAGLGVPVTNEGPAAMKSLIGRTK